MAGLKDEFALSQNALFQNRVAMAAVRKAITIAGETTSAGLNPPRKRLARQVLADPIENAKGLALVLARDTVLALKAPDETLITDVEITTALSDAIWDGYAQTFA